MHFLTIIQYPTYVRPLRNSNSPTHSPTPPAPPTKELVVEMARRWAFQDNPELQQLVLPNVQLTGRQLGVGSYSSVEELLVNGLVCAGKRLNEIFLEGDKEGVIKVERKYFKECQVTPTTIIAVAIKYCIL